MGIRLKGMREESGFSRLDVALKLDLTEEGYANYERGVSRIVLTDVPRFAVALGVSNRALLARLGLLQVEFPAEMRNAEIPDSELERQLGPIIETWSDADERGRSLSSTLLDSAYRVLRQSRANAKINHGPIRRELVRSCPVLSTQSA